jgi:hypothetical protein
LRDITERQKMGAGTSETESLSHQGAGRRHCHDFNNLLMGILGNIALSRMQVRPDSKAAQLLDAAEDARSGQRS